MPTRSSSRDPQLPRTRPQRVSRSRISTAARTARNASSSWTIGITENAVSPPPIDLSTVAPCRASTGAPPSKPRAASLRSAPGSSSCAGWRTRMTAPSPSFAPAASAWADTGSLASLGDERRAPDGHVELRVLRENPALELPQLGARLEPELLRELRSPRSGMRRAPRPADLTGRARA